MRIRPALRPLVLLAAAAACTAQAATYPVGPAGMHPNLNALFAAVDLGPGDVVEVQGGVTYAGDIVMPAADGGAAGNPVTLRGVGATRPRLHGGTNTIEFRLSDHVVFERFEVTGDAGANTFRCVYHHAHDIVIRDAVIHDCPRHGVLGADQDSGSLTIEYSEIYNAGSGGGNHLVYMATDEFAHPGSVFRLQHSYLHDSDYTDGAGTGGNLVKSRAERNEIYYNWLEGGYFHELELIGPDPDGNGNVTELTAREDSDVVGNVIVHTSAFGALVRFGGDETGQSLGRYRVVNNTIVRLGFSDTPTVFRLFDGIESLDAHNNVIWREGGNGVRVIREVEAFWTTGSSRIAGTGNWVDANSTFLPPGWSGTLQGPSPGFASAAGFDFRPVAGSALLDAANPGPVALPGYGIAAPLDVPLLQPPPRVKPAQGAAAPRVPVGTLDIGAFELDDGAWLFSDGFEG
jgi:hypothetical protein